MKNTSKKPAAEKDSNNVRPEGAAPGIDLHVHTTFSPDSQIPPDRACRTAVGRGLKVIGFSDHAEFVHEDEAYVSERYSGSGILEEIQRLRTVYEGRLEILYGVEVGFIPGMEREIKDFLASHPFDYAIGSVHYVEGTLVSRWVRETEDKELSFTPYFEALLGAASSGLFQILGHLDYVRKYMYAPQNYLRGDYAELVGRIISTAASKELVIELNTSGWRQATDEPFPGKEILRLLASAGGMATYGSDAHKYYEIGYAERRAGQLFRESGFDSVQVFRQRKRTAVKI